MCTPWQQCERNLAQWLRCDSPLRLWITTARKQAGIGGGDASTFFSLLCRQYYYVKEVMSAVAPKTIKDSKSDLKKAANERCKGGRWFEQACEVYRKRVDPGPGGG